MKECHKKQLRDLENIFCSLQMPDAVLQYLPARFNKKPRRWVSMSRFKSSWTKGNLLICIAANILHCTPMRVYCKHSKADNKIVASWDPNS